MKKRLMYMLVCFICVAVLFGCAEEKHISDQNAFQSIAQVGQIPDEFKHIVANNAFNGVKIIMNNIFQLEHLFPRATPLTSHVFVHQKQKIMILMMWLLQLE